MAIFGVKTTKRKIVDKIRMMKKEILSFIFILIISSGLVCDLFINQGQPVTFDGPTHITNIAMFFKSLKEGNVRVTWTDGFANYGMPLGLMAQQTTSYLGALINFFTANPLLSYNLVFFFGAFFSNLTFYFFLRQFFSYESSLIATYLFNLAPYRIINIYIRGALPEFFVCLFLPILLFSIRKFLEKRNFFYFILISLTTAFIILTHPFMIIIYFPIVFLFVYFFFLNSYKKINHARNEKNHYKYTLFLSFILGILLSSYFILPLVVELRYFYYGKTINHFNLGHFLSFKNFFDPSWYYFYQKDIATRGHFMKTGLLESLLILSFWLLFLFKKKFNKKILPLLKTVFFSSFIYIFFLTLLSSFIYQIFPILGNIQHPWRMLSGFIFLPPIILAFFIEKIRNYKIKIFTIFLLLITISMLRIPQIYGKNYQLINIKNYFFTKENLHGVILNTVWTDKSENYPVKKIKGEIIEGKGELIIKKIKNNFRHYQLLAKTPVRVVDYTFYFPGWRVYANGKKIPIEFQDPNYRGIITYKLPTGKYQILVKFEETPIRIVGILVSFLTFLFLIFLYVKRKTYFAN